MAPISSKRLHLHKVIAWRITSTICAGLISWAYLGEFSTATTLTLMLACIMTFIHYIFEMAWEEYIDNGL